MSHEIRTPMNGVLGLTHLLQRTQVSDRQRDYLEGLEGAGRSLLRIINDILDFSKIDAGKLELELAPFDLDRLLEDVAQHLQPLLKDKPVDLVVRRDPGMPARLQGDAVRFKQVLCNLAGNAAKFTERGEVSIALDAVPGERPLLRMVVRDTGIGMSEAQQARLFQPFTQADASTTRRFGGTGLGLVISRRLVELMDGTIAVHSRPGHGSEFTVTLPLQAAGAAASQAFSGAPGPVPVPKLAGELLLVEDNELNQMVATGLLGELGLTVELAGDGLQAIALLKAGRRFDAVLLDLQMPGLDGFSTLRAIRAMPGLGRLPVIAMTANAMAGERERCLAAGMDDYVSKPIDPAVLIACLQRWLPRKAA
jgi:CheY-like chemotaxis protein/two-component sensor histidine kinase